MIKIESESDLQSISGNLSPSIYQFISNWYHERENGDDYQGSLYCSPYPIGSMGPVWISETQADIKGKEFVELIQFIISEEILFIGVYLPTNGEENADIFIPSEILDTANLQLLVSKIDSVERIDEEC